MYPWIPALKKYASLPISTVKNMPQSEHLKQLAYTKWTIANWSGHRLTRWWLLEELCDFQGCSFWYMVRYSSTQSWYIIKNNGTAFSAAATKILGLEGGNTQEFKTLSLSLGQKGYNSLSFWKKNNFFKKSFNFCRVPQVSKCWFSQTCLSNKNTPALLQSVHSCRNTTAGICTVVTE